MSVRSPPRWRSLVDTPPLAIALSPLAARATRPERPMENTNAHACHAALRLELRAKLVIDVFTENTRFVRPELVDFVVHDRKKRVGYVPFVRGVRNSFGTTRTSVRLASNPDRWIDALSNFRGFFGAILALGHRVKIVSRQPLSLVKRPSPCLNE